MTLGINETGNPLIVMVPRQKISDKKVIFSGNLQYALIIGRPFTRCLYLCRAASLRVTAQHNKHEILYARHYTDNGVVCQRDIRRDMRQKYKIATRLQRGAAVTEIAVAPRGYWDWTCRQDRSRFTSFSTSTATKTMEDRARVKASSGSDRGSVLKMGFKKGT